MKNVLSTIFISILILTMVFYFFVPYQSFYINSNSNFSLSFNESDDMLFYQNLRFLSPNISYKINDECILKKKNDMTNAFSIIENLTILNFYESNDPDIYVNCDERIRYSGKMLIAGEGGPNQIIQSGKYNIINQSQIILVRKSECPKPIVAIHELLHALGFKHSSNNANIMYNFSSCNQEIGDDIINKINELYSTQNFFDLGLDNLWVSYQKRMLNFNLTIYNVGLMSSPNAKLIVSSKDSILKEFQINSLEPGVKSTLSVENLFVSKIYLGQITFEIVHTDFERNKKNNKLELNVED